MSKILITGNGFDLNLLLPTSYNNFITILNYLESNQEVDFTIYQHLGNDNLIPLNFNLFELNGEKIKILKNQMKSNLWYDFFKNEFQIETWIDFENKIEYVLKTLFNSTEYIKKNVFGNGSIDIRDKTKYSPRLFNNDEEIVQVLQNFSIIKLDEYREIEFNEEYLVSKYNHFINIDIDKITRILSQDLNDFKRIFNYYFEIFVFPLYANIKKKLDRNQFEMIDKHFTFNYTPTFEKIYDDNLKTQFLHGRIDSQLNEIVLGISEIPSNNLDDKYFLPFTKYFQKLDIKADYLFLKEIEDSKDYNHMFFFIGHSLDKSDDNYINEVFDFVNKSTAKIKHIVVAYHTVNSKSQLLINLLNIRGKKDIEKLMKDGVLLFEQFDSIEFKDLLNKDIREANWNIGIY